jgi:hypothetical protein
VRIGQVLTQINLQSMRRSDNSSLHNSRVASKGALQLSRADAVSRYVEHVVCAACDPVVPVLVPAAPCVSSLTALQLIPLTISREVVAVKATEVCLLEACVVSEHRAHLASGENRTIRPVTQPVQAMLA